ncbi:MULTISPECIES: DUF4352 domain-containing protein [unclassified Rhodococcus (in: high G+C Gram-positive bacteria)]|uniref:DUF4352 domain-containing protein n=1 Tax=unclassified Rhodococcus (in: high G+C Gram-positive bacteria) TaxID=192944 RepID=UPI0029529769|nr:DUF4352 domain-containing protein [Rhodococcus sp. IEGM 1343]MDV8057657.1 DUF4352 domain-containing protein [Rhodococcus sp. IEGM 1343]
MTTPRPATPAGFYPDPSGRPGQSYWDGNEWGGQPPEPPKKSHKLRKGLLIGLGVFVALVIVVSLTGTDDSGSTGSGAGAPAESSSDIASAGSAVRDGKFEFQVTTVASAKTVSDPTDNPYMTADAQGEFIVVTMRVKNIGDKPQSYFGDNQKMIDAQGREYGASSEAGMYMNTEVAVLGEINPGNSIDVKVAFDVPPGTAPATLQLHDSMFSSGVKVALA